MGRYLLRTTREINKHPKVPLRILQPPSSAEPKTCLMVRMPKPKRMSDISQMALGKGVCCIFSVSESDVATASTTAELPLFLTELL